MGRKRRPQFISSVDLAGGVRLGVLAAASAFPLLVPWPSGVAASLVM